MNYIWALREDQDLRQIDVSREAKIDQKALLNYETGKMQPEIIALIRLTALLMSVSTTSSAEAIFPFKIAGI